MPPYLRLVDASACWNASKMIFCFSSGMPMPVSETSKATTCEAWLRDRVGCRPATNGGGHVQAHAALGGELEGVRQQVFENLLQPFGIRGDGATEIEVEVDVE